MKLNFKKLTLISTSFLVLNSAHAYKYIIYTDEVKTVKAQEVAEMMKTTYPFSKFSIEVEIVRLSPEELRCGSRDGVERKVGCNNIQKIQRKALRAGGDQAMIIKDFASYGGSSQIGGGVPVITTGTSSRAMLHEYMHTIGLCDEYEYPASEARMVCGGSNKPNLVFINPLDPYPSDSRAKAKHAKDIPWFGDINNNTPITNSGGTRLGTGEVDAKDMAAKNVSNVPQTLSEPTGLYKGKICNNAPKKKESWHPGSKATIMENVNAGLGKPLEKIVERILISKGAKLKLEHNTLETTEESMNGEIPEDSVASSQNNEKIDNSKRSFFKTFFDWTKNVFDKTKNVLSR